jgi:hypothetical protein
MRKKGRREGRNVKKQEEASDAVLGNDTAIETETPSRPRQITPQIAPPIAESTIRSAEEAELAPNQGSGYEVDHSPGSDRSVEVAQQDRRRTRAAAILSPSRLERLDEQTQAKTGEKKVETITRFTRRHAIAYVFIKTLGAPAESEWSGKGGSIAKAAGILKIPVGSETAIRTVFKDASFCVSEGIRYDGVKNYGTKMGRPVLISTDSMEAQIVANAIESGYSIRTAMELVNEFREGKNQDAHTYSAVYGVYQRLLPKARKIPMQRPQNT